MDVGGILPGRGTGLVYFYVTIFNIFVNRLPIIEQGLVLENEQLILENFEFFGQFLFVDRINAVGPVAVRVVEDLLGKE